MGAGPNQWMKVWVGGGIWVLIFTIDFHQSNSNFKWVKQWGLNSKFKLKLSIRIWAKSVDESVGWGRDLSSDFHHWFSPLVWEGKFERAKFSRSPNAFSWCAAISRHCLNELKDRESTLFRLTLEWGLKTQIIHSNLSQISGWKCGLGEGFEYRFSPLIFTIDFHSSRKPDSLIHQGVYGRMTSVFGCSETLCTPLVASDFG